MTAFHRISALILVCLAVPFTASAVTHEVSIYLDLDDDTVTGCDVLTVDGTFEGAEQVLISTVETSASPDAGNVTDVAIADCAGGTFGAPVSFDGNWPVGVGNGLGGRDVVETYVPLVQLVVSEPSVIHLGVVVTDELGNEEALLTVDDTPGGDPIVLSLQSILEIPTLSQWGLLLLALLLAAASLVLLGRRGMAALGVVLLLLAAGTAWAAGTLDGLTGDWTAADQLGANSIVLYGKDGGDQLCFRVDVDLLFNQPPTITDVANQTIPEDGTTGPLAFIVSDAESAVTALPVTATSSNQVLVPDGNLTLGGSGAHRTIEVAPAANQNGMTDVTVTVEDPDGGTASTTFQVTVTSDNDPPTISAIADQTIDEDTSTGPLAFTVGDVETPPGSLTVTAASSDQTIIPDGNLALAGTDANRTITVTPAADQNGGPVTITVTVMDTDGGSVPEQFEVTVNPVNDPPTITAIADQTIDEDTSTGALAFTIDDVDDTVGSLTVSAASSDQTLIPDGNLAIGGVAPNLTIEATPAADENGGPVTITVTVTDPSAAPGSETFDVTVNPVNDPPVAVNETFDVAAGNFEPAIGNTTLQFANTETVTEPHVFQSGDVLDNDSDIENDPLSITAVDGDAGAVGTAKTLPSGAVVTLEADGELTYSPPLGFEGNDSFTYTVFDGTDSSTATVNVEIAGMVWYLDNDPANDGTGDDGRAASPFDTIAQFDAENGGGGADDPEAGDVIFIFEGTATYDAGDTDGIDLLAGQKLYGEGVALVVGSTTLVPAGNRPAVDNPTGGGDAVTVLADVTEGNKTGVEIRGLEISGDDNAVEVTSADAATVGVLISDNLFAASGGAAIDANPGSSGAFDLTVENNTYATSSPTGNGIDVATAAGNSADVEVAINGNTDVTSSSGVGINLNGSQGTGTLFVTGFADNTVHGNTGGAGVMAADVTFDADPSDTDFDEVAAGTWSVGSGANPVGGAGVYLGTIAAAVEGNLSFTQLDVFAGNGAGLDVAGAGLFGGGTPGSGFQLVIGTGTINATNGPAVTIDPATLNAAFASLTSNDSATTGISLTSVAGSFTATTVAIDDTTGAGVAIASSSATVALNGGVIGETAGSATTTGGNAVDVDGSSGNVTVAAAIANTAGRSVEVTNHTGGATLGFSGAIDDDGAGVFLNANGASGGATINFTGGLDLATTTSDAFTATGGGTVNVTDGLVTNVITTTTGTAILVNGMDLTSAFDSVAVSAGTGPGVSLQASAGVKELGLLSITNAGGVGLFASDAGQINVTNGASSIVTTGQAAVDADNTSFDATFAGLTSDDSAAAGIDLASVGGNFSATSVAIDDTTGAGVQLSGNTATVALNGGTIGETTNSATTTGGNAVDIDGGTGSVTVAAAITNTAARSVEVTNRTGSTVSFTGAIVDNGATNSGILLDNNDSGTVQFTGTVDVTGTSGAGVTYQNSGGGLTSFADLDVDNSATNQIALLASNNAGGGTLDITTGTVHGGTNSAVDIDTTNLGITLFSATSIGGAPVGIDLATTTGSFTVTGDGATGGGGLFADNNGSGGAITGKTGNGVRLDDVTNVSLNYMNINSNQGSGIHGTDVDGFVLTRTNLVGNGDAVDESGLRFGLPDGSKNGLVGSAVAGTNPTRISHVDASASSEHNVEIINTAGVLTDLVVENSRFRDTNTSGLGADGFLVETRSSAVGTVSVSGSTFSGNATQGIQGQAIDTSSLQVDVTGSTFDNNNEGLVLSTSGSGQLSFDISNNPAFTNHDGVAIFVGTTSSATAASSVTGTISGNTNIQTPSGAVNHSVIVFPSGASSAVILVDGNTITNDGFFRGINVTTTDNVGDTTDLDITIINNTVTNGADADHAILVEGRQSASVCAKIEGNSATAVSATKFGIRLRERDSSTVQLEEGSSASSDPATVLSDNNPLSAAFSVTGAPAVVANNTCDQVP